MVQGLVAHTEAWGDASRKGENRLTRLINAKMEMLYRPLRVPPFHLEARFLSRAHNVFLRAQIRRCSALGLLTTQRRGASPFLPC